MPDLQYENGKNEVQLCVILFNIRSAVLSAKHKNIDFLGLSKHNSLKIKSSTLYIHSFQLFTIAAKDISKG